MSENPLIYGAFILAIVAISSSIDDSRRISLLEERVAKIEQVSQSKYSPSVPTNTLNRVSYTNDLNLVGETQ